MAADPATPALDLARTRVLLGERLCLDFANSANWVACAPVDDALQTARDVSVWLGRALGVAPEAVAAGPDTPARLVRVRDALRAVLAAVARQDAPGAAELSVLDAAEERAGLRLAPARGGFACETPTGDAADWAPALMARSAQELLVSGDRTRLKVCAGPRCGWLFLDRSPRAARRWCRMETCGNRAKARGHYARRRDPGAIRTP